MNWKPIETAPKDGTAVDLWIDFRRITDAYWRKGPMGEGWHYASGEGMDDSQPTHWMPLPPPPTNETE
jgi:hypothetical protein